ncbi:MAG: Het-C domain-containing protein [Spirochaetia bacterium]|nr:Het-C domain-containing protein [Spirochaetia bacterium]
MMIVKITEKFSIAWLPMILLLVITNNKPVSSFSGDGPYNHDRITRIALDEFAKKTGWELGFECSQILIQGTIVNDNAAFQDPTYHCNNNNIAGCSYRLDQLEGKAAKEIVSTEAFIKMGMALHIIHDFYAHSNWVEKLQISMIIAPLENFKDIPPPHWLQSGYYPNFYLPDPYATVYCFIIPEEQWGEHFEGATHACLNKNANTKLRGMQWVPNGGGMTYHELAGKYAIKHTVKKLEEFKANNTYFQLCLRPRGFVGCRDFFNKSIQRNL